MCPSKRLELISVIPLLQRQHKHQKSNDVEHKANQVMISHNEIDPLICQNQLSQFILQKFPVRVKHTHSKEVPVYSLE